MIEHGNERKTLSATSSFGELALLREVRQPIPYEFRAGICCTFPRCNSAPFCRTA